PGLVPDTLVAAFLRTSCSIEHNGPPNKRLKLSLAPQSLRDLNGLLTSEIPLGYIPLARCHIRLLHQQNFAHSRSAESLLHSFKYVSRLPVVVQTVTAASVYSDTTVNKDKLDSLQLNLLAVPGQEVIFSDRITDRKLIDAIDGELLGSLPCADRFVKSVPSVCYQATLHQLPDGKSFRLETVILWKDSKDILDSRSLLPASSRVFSKYVLRESDGSLMEHTAHTQRFQGQGASWSPRDFYENVHVPPDMPTGSAEIKCALTECQLFPFQRRTVRWLLQREGVKLCPDGQVIPIEVDSDNDLPASFIRITDADGKCCYASHLLMIVTTDISAQRTVLRGGILAEEMGLGKTVEMISLMCLHRRKLLPETLRPSPTGGLRPSRATLIITPPAILDQWREEILLHAPSLRVFHYEGINRHHEISERGLIDMVADHDVVLTTYNVLAREIHYSGNAPQRNLRHEKRFEPRKTPLVQIHWWRVCLDEAQMIESGVSNAARVARLIPRQLAWAVTGTPIRKDITDLLGLLLFLRYDPFCGSIWNRLCRSFRPVLARITQTIALRNSKDRIRGELRIPPQKRFVITIPFTAVEEQHYRQLYEQMCEECGLDISGAPIHDYWNPNDSLVIEKMRSWLARLRQTCLHPNQGRGFTAGSSGPLRSVQEVLEVMIDENDVRVNAQERERLLLRMRRGQLLENALRKREALELWRTCFERASAIVNDCRGRLQTEIERLRVSNVGTSQESASNDLATNDESEDSDKSNRIGTYRQRLRTALEVQHMGIFFMGNAYYQIKSDLKLTDPDSDEFKSLEQREEEAYATAKSIRKEILTDVSKKVGNHMRIIKEMLRNKRYVVIPKMKPQIYNTGVEARRVLENFEDFCEAMNKHAAQYDEWRRTMVHLLSQSLIDQEDESELQGNEYESSTKHQDEMYVYMEALRAMFADRHDCLTGQRNVLIAHEVKGGVAQAQKGEGPSPELFLNIMNMRSRMKPDPKLGSLRGIISELRSLTTSLEWQATEGSARARAEMEIASLVLKNASAMAAEHSKVVSSLEREVEMFRDTMNYRLEYYRQLQQISDTVAPFDEESVGKPLDEAVFEAKLSQENVIDGRISALRAKHRYLIHLRDEPSVDESTRICVICQSGFEIGVLTVCGHHYCQHCLGIWWRQHRTCPTCKRRLKANDFHQITYKPQDYVVQEEKAPTKAMSERPSSTNSIYHDISSSTLNEIKNIDLNSSFGTKIDTLARHIMWLREHDPGAKSVVFSQYKNFLEILASALSRFKIGFSSVDSKDGIQNFKSDPALECFLLHARAHSSGLNLICATNVIFCEPLINTAIELQAIARVHRIGQHRPTTVWMYLVSDTVEESIYDLSVSRRLAHIMQKEEQQEDRPSESLVNGAHETASTTLTETAIDAANSLEIQDAPLSKMMASGPLGGELVQEDDLWRCLFRKANSTHMDAAGEVARFLEGEAAEQRSVALLNS
ncbi:putative SNF2 family helicase/ATPase, partial [Aspergillus brunneoviolaceus CBS 621.78]